MHADVHYYDAIAADYDRLFDEVAGNAAVRRTVQEYFSSHVRNGVVMDFGGGTGLDLPWLLQTSNKIVFCEPASKMREIAMQRVHDHPLRDKVVFLNDEKSDFSNWPLEASAEDKVDACLANFAVLNNIRNLTTPFEKLASVIRPAGDLVINVLDAGSRSLITRYPKEYIRSFFSKEIVTYTKYQGVTQKVYLHPIAKLRMSAHPYFEITDTLPLKASGFLLIHLRRR